jgi:hypothetical protein
MHVLKLLIWDNFQIVSYVNLNSWKYKSWCFCSEWIWCSLLRLSATLGVHIVPMFQCPSWSDDDDQDGHWNVSTIRTPNTADSPRRLHQTQQLKSSRLKINYNITYLTKQERGDKELNLKWWARKKWHL